MYSMGVGAGATGQRQRSAVILRGRHNFNDNPVGNSELKVISHWYSLLLYFQALRIFRLSLACFFFSFVMYTETCLRAIKRNTSI